MSLLAVPVFARSQTLVSQLPDAPSFTLGASAVSGLDETDLRSPATALRVSVAPGASAEPEPVVPPSPPLRPRTADAIARSQLAAACESGETRGKPCRVHWLKTLGEAMEFMSLQHLGNFATDSEIRNDVENLPFWSTYVQCVKNYRWDQWSDDTPFIVHDIGHPLMGGITSSIFEQNDPKGRALVFVNNGNYWRSRTKAMAFSAVYSAEWKIGPLSEASIGNSGLNTYYVPSIGRTTNETGFQDFIITPVYGMGWNVMEDLTDRFVWPHIHEHIKNRLLLTALFWITPAKSGANILRFKPTYYRDTDR